MADTDAGGQNLEDVRTAIAAIDALDKLNLQDVPYPIVGQFEEAASDLRIELINLFCEYAEALGEEIPEEYL